MAAQDNAATPGAGVEPVLAHLFSEARTYSSWLPKPVPDGLIEQALSLALFGPTSANCEPMRVVLVRSPEAKEKLLGCVSSGNTEKVRTAPVTAIVAYDLEFFEQLPKLFPHADARAWFTSNEALAKETAFRNGSLQGGYFTLALRAVGLDCGAMSGFDAGKVDAAFFADSKWRANFLMNIGYGERDKVFPRLPRLAIDEVAKWA